MLSKGLTIKSLSAAHESILRNKLIANVFYVRGFIEKWGTGTNRMIELCQQENIPIPSFMEKTGGLAVTFRFQETARLGVDHENMAISEELNPRRELILDYMREVKVASTQQLLEHLAETLPTHLPTRKTVTRDLNYLKAKGLVTLKGEKRGAEWILRENES